jgi:hypothetical protein
LQDACQTTKRFKINILENRTRTRKFVIYEISFF